MRQTTYNYIAKDTAYIAALQTLGAAGNMVINGTGLDQNSPTGRVLMTGVFERKISLTSTGNISGVNFTIYGRDIRGNSITETIAGPNNNTVLTTGYFFQVDRIATNGAVGTNTSAGIDIGRSNWMKFDNFNQPVDGSVIITVTGTINYTVVYTGDDVEINSSPITINHPDSAVVNATAQGTGNFAFPCNASRIEINSSTNGTLTGNYYQAGI